MDVLIPNLLNIEKEWVHKILFTILTIIIFSLINAVTKIIIYKRIKDLKSRFNRKKTASYISVFIATLIIIRIWFAGFHTFITFLGILSAGIAIALKDIILNYAGWTYIIWRKPFILGQRIQIGDIKGDVVDIRPFQFILMEIGSWVGADQSTGRLVHIPNGLVFTTPIHNYEAGFSFIWSEILINITFESNWEKAKEILYKVLKETTPDNTETLKKQLHEAANEYLIYHNISSPIVYTFLSKQGIEFNIRYLVPPRERRLTDSKISEEILRRFLEEKDINYSYPTTRFVDYPSERKDK